jgi:hypothetical protein
MKIILFCIFLLTLAQSKLSITDIYFEIKEKERLDYLNQSSKFSLRNINNTFLDENNTLHSRNSELSRVVTYYQSVTSSNPTRTSLSDDDIVHLRKLEEISFEMSENNEEITCDTMVNNEFNNIQITMEDCLNLDVKLRAIFKTGVYSGKKFDNYLNSGGIVRLIDPHQVELDRLNNASFYERMKKITIEDIRNEQIISLMNGEDIESLCQKYDVDNNKNFLNKEITINVLENRAITLGRPSLAASCTNYFFSDHSYDTSLVTNEVPTGRVSNYLTSLLNAVCEELRSLSLSKDTKTDEINTFLIGFDELNLRNQIRILRVIYNIANEIKNIDEYITAVELTRDQLIDRIPGDGHSCES